jgi:hypothetical protein
VGSLLASFGRADPANARGWWSCSAFGLPFLVGGFQAFLASGIGRGSPTELNERPH